MNQMTRCRMCTLFWKYLPKRRRKMDGIVELIEEQAWEDRSWATRLGRYALGTAECTNCGHVVLHAMPGPWRPEAQMSDGRVITLGELAIHVCGRCGQRMRCGYSGDPQFRRQKSYGTGPAPIPE